MGVEGATDEREAVEASRARVMEQLGRGRGWARWQTAGAEGARGRQRGLGWWCNGGEWAAEEEEVVMVAAPWSGIVGGEGLGWWASGLGLCLEMIGEWVIGARARVGVCAGTNDDQSAAVAPRQQEILEVLLIEDVEQKNADATAMMVLRRNVDESGGGQGSGTGPAERR